MGRTCRRTGRQNTSKMNLFTLLFTDDQVVLAHVEDFAWALETHLQKTQYLVVGEEGQDLRINQVTIKNRRSIAILV